MTLFKHFIYAFLSSIGFAIMFSIPKDSIIKSGLVGAIGQLAFYISSSILSSDMAGFLRCNSCRNIRELFARTL